MRLVFTLQRDLRDPIALFESILWFAIALLSFYALTLLGKLEDPQPPMETLRQKIEDLERQDERHQW